MKLEIIENDKINKENMVNFMFVEIINNLGLIVLVNEIVKRIDIIEFDLEGVRVLIYIYDVWVRDIYKYEFKIKDDKSLKSDLDVVKVLNYIYDVWVRDIFKYEFIKKFVK